jgi:hypothetical protein
VQAVDVGVDMVYIAGVNGSGGDAIGKKHSPRSSAQPKTGASLTLRSKRPTPGSRR